MGGREGVSGRKKRSWESGIKEEVKEGRRQVERGCPTHQSLKCLVTILGQLLSDLNVHQLSCWGGHSAMPLVLLGCLRWDMETPQSYDVHQLESRLGR